MNIKEKFVIQYYPFADKASEKSGVPILFALAQSALESGWGKSAHGNMMFGVKKGSGKNYGGWNGDTQLITTTEYSSSKNKSFPFVYPGYPRQQANGKWKYKIKDFFRAYPNPFFSFMDWAGLLFKNSRYSVAMSVRRDPYRFAEEVAKAGYATDPNYSSKVQGIMREIEKIIIQKGLNKPQKNIVIPMILIGVSVLAVITAIMKGNSK